MIFENIPNFDLLVQDPSNYTFIYVLEGLRLRGPKIFDGQFYSIFLK